MVEDDAVLRDLWIEVFSGAGHEVAGGSNVADPRVRLLARSRDVVLLDLHLGSESGLSLAMRATYANPEARVTMITGSSLFVRGEIFEMASAVATVQRKLVPFGSSGGLERRAPAMG